VVSVLGVQFVALFSGSVIIESLFGLPGLGQAASNAITSYDFRAVEGVVIVASLVVVLVNLLLDLLVAGLDPRVRAR
jgi:peptide/nickel transport system permease protein